MLCFEIYLNGEKLCTAGVPEHGTLSAAVGWYHRMRMEGAPALDDFNGELHVTGFEDRDPWSGEYVKWFAELANWVPGDEIVIKVIESESPDPPQERGFELTPEQEKIGKELRRHHYEKLKREFEAEREFETERKFETG